MAMASEMDDLISSLTYKEFSNRTIASDDRKSAGSTMHVGHLLIAGAGFVGVDGDTSSHDDGIVEIRSLKLNLTRLSLLDPFVRDGDGFLLNNLVS